MLHSIPVGVCGTHTYKRLAATGARVSELIQIKAEHVKLGHLDLYSKGGKLRRIYIPKELQKEALSWLWYATLI